MLVDTGGASSIRKRVSTPAPVDVERWDDEPEDFLFQEEEVVPPVDTSLSLSLDRLALPERREWGAAYAPPPPEPEMQMPIAPDSLRAGANEYGISGATGLAKYRGSSPYGLQPQMWSALSRANAAMKAAGLGTFKITDGFRSLEAQKRLKQTKPRLAATPGRSIHGIGYAADLQLTKKQAEWLRVNGARYGLFAGAGFKREPWHWQLLPSLAR